MFLKSSGFKKIINEAYKGVGLSVGNDGNGYYIHGGYWVIWIRKGCISKKRFGKHHRADWGTAGTRNRIYSDKSREPV